MMRLLLGGIDGDGGGDREGETKEWIISASVWTIVLRVIEREHPCVCSLNRLVVNWMNELGFGKGSLQ